ncbi:hypothetical protein MY10362_006731 [Beauveria mimosiformis]
MPQAYAHYREPGILKSEDFAARCWHLSLRCTGKEERGKRQRPWNQVSLALSATPNFSYHIAFAGEAAKLLHAPGPQFTGNFG